MQIDEFTRSDFKKSLSHVDCKIFIMMIKTYCAVSVFSLTVILMIEEKSLNNLKEINKSNKNKTTNDKSLPHNYQTF